jgi:hypothetical protein
MIAGRIDFCFGSSVLDAVSANSIALVIHIASSLVDKSVERDIIIGLVFQA